MTVTEPDEAAAPKPFPDSSDFSVGLIAIPMGGQISLRTLLRIIDEEAGNRPRVIERIRDTFFCTRRPAQQLKSAANPLIALNENNYGLLRPGQLRLNEIGREILKAATDDRAVELFSRHIVRNLCGQDLLRAIRSVRSRGETPNKKTLAFDLGLLGYAIGPTHTDATHMAGWLKAAGILRGWEVDESRLFNLTGITLTDIEEWAELDEPKRAVLRAIRRSAEVHGTDPISVDSIREDVEALYGGSIWKRPDNVPQDVLYPLAGGDWITRPVRPPGRGARGGIIRALPRLIKVEIDVLDRQLLSGLPAEVRHGLKRPLADLFSDLDNENDLDAAGRALEILAARIAIELGLTGLRLRDRSEWTGGIEVDLIADFLGRTYERWVIQCKNTKVKAGPEVLSRELGVALVTHATTVVLVARGGFSERLQRLATRVSIRTPLQVILLDGEALDRYMRRGVGAIVLELKRQALRTAEMKRDASRELDA